MGTSDDMPCYRLVFLVLHLSINQMICVLEFQCILLRKTSCIKDIRKVLQERQCCGFDPSLRKLYAKSLLVHCTLARVLGVG